MPRVPEECYAAGQVAVLYLNEAKRLFFSAKDNYISSNIKHFVSLAESHASSLLLSKNPEVRAYAHHFHEEIKKFKEKV